MLLNFTDYQCVIDRYFYSNTTALNCAVAGPAFASSIIFELYEDDSEEGEEGEMLNYVRIRYNGEYMRLCEKDSTTCEYSEFRNRIVEGFPKNFAAECVNKNKLKEE